MVDSLVRMSLNRIINISKLVIILVEEYNVYRFPFTSTQIHMDRQTQKKTVMRAKMRL
jgi:hypothetical protein